MDGKLLAANKKAYFDYEVAEKYETGIILTGAEVKSIKGGHTQLKGSFATVDRGKIIVENMHVSPYKHAVIDGYDPLRRKELLLHKKEIVRLASSSAQKGCTLIPLEVILKNNLIKVVLGVCHGKKQHDKRNVLKRRAMQREVDQSLKKFSR